MRRRHPSRHLMLTLSLIVSVAALLPSLALAQHASVDSADAIFTSQGLIAPVGCQDLSGMEALAARAQRWSRAIEALAKTHPDRLHGWLVGALPPPQLAMHESTHQRDCMIAALVRDAAKPNAKLILDFGDDVPKTASAMREHARRFEQSPAVRRKIIRHFEQSHYRDAANQAYIWHSKFTFTLTRSFNHISESAAKKCGLHPGGSWRPDHARHQRCWKEQLTAKERQREILNASSAPGISRHHWGSEFDLYGLNPRRFLSGADLHDEYLWMKDNALHHGFFQPFTGHAALGELTYIEERWHWSYYPIAHALSRYIERHPERFEASLDALWRGYERKWSHAKEVEQLNHFSYVRESWRGYVLNIARLASISPTWPHAPLFTAHLDLPWMSPSSLLRMAMLG